MAFTTHAIAWTNPGMRCTPAAKVLVSVRDAWGNQINKYSMAQIKAVLMNMTPCLPPSSACTHVLINTIRPTQGIFKDVAVAVEVEVEPVRYCFM